MFRPLASLCFSQSKDRPRISTTKNNGNKFFFNFIVWIKVMASKSSSKVPKPSGHDTNPLAILTKHHLSHKKIIKNLNFLSRSNKGYRVFKREVNIKLPKFRLANVHHGTGFHEFPGTTSGNNTVTSLLQYSVATSTPSCIKYLSPSFTFSSEPKNRTQDHLTHFFRSR